MDRKAKTAWGEKQKVQNLINVDNDEELKMLTIMVMITVMMIVMIMVASDEGDDDSDDNGS